MVQSEGLYMLIPVLTHLSLYLEVQEVASMWPGHVAVAEALQSVSRSKTRRRTCFPQRTMAPYSGQD